MRKLVLMLFTSLALLASGCSRQLPVAPAGGQADLSADAPVDMTALDKLERIAARRDHGFGVISDGRPVVTVPAGSVNALAAAITAAGANGVVLLKAGVHTESGTVQITQPVTVFGEPGAQLVSAAGTAVPGWWHPALDVRGDHVTIQGLDIVSSRADAQATGVWFGAGGDDGMLFDNRISGFVQSALINRANRVKVWRNRFDVAAGGDGLDIPNGRELSVLRNEVLNAGFVGMFLSGTNSVAAYNNAHDCYIGLLFCKVPAGSLPLPEGGTDGSDVSAANWFATGNEAVNNFNDGILVIDGANHSVLTNNPCSGNGGYDIELAGDSFRFGFLTPTSHEIKLISSRYPDTRVKNCGANNTVVGGSLVDNGFDPCN